MNSATIPPSSRLGSPAPRCSGGLVHGLLAALATAACEGDPIPPNPNASPRLTGPIPHQVVEDSVVLDLTAHFVDPDGDALTFTATSANTAAVSAHLAGALVTLVAIVKGSATVTVTATDPHGASATHDFPATVPNRAPRVAISLPDVEAFVEDRVATRVGGYFSDPDHDSLTFSAETSDAAVATVELAGDEVTVGARAPGMATIAVAATDPEGLAATQDFVLTVPNRAPRATEPLPGIEVEVGNEATLRVSGHFMDPDGEELTYAAESSEGGVAGAVVSGDEVTVSALAKGMATITVTATDPGGGVAVQDFPVTVPNRAPQAVDTLPDIEVEVGGEASATVSGYFADPDGDSLTFAGGSFDEAVATVSARGDRLTVRAVAKGTSAITVTAEDPEGLTAVLSFEVRVPNRPPLVTGMLPDMSVEVGEAAGTDLTEHFTEPDGDELVFAAESSDPDVATTSVSGSRMTVGAVAKGVATVTITAADSEGLAVEQSFLITVPNRPPRGTHPLPDFELEVGEESATDLTEHFADPDGDTLRFVAESSDSTVAVVHASRGRVTVGALARGTVTVTVTASDPEDLAATGVFRVTVPNRAPLAVDTIPNIEVEVGGEASMRLSRYFADADGDALAFTGASFDESVATAGVSDDRLTVRGVAKGMSAITVTAEDPEGLTAVLAFEVRVPNRPPRVTAMLPGVSVEVGETAAADLTEHFTEPDGDELVFAAESSDPDVATADISGDRVTVEAVAKGVATVTITAADPEGLAVEQSFLITVPNRPPRGTHPLPDFELEVGEESATDLTEHFADPDGDTLRFVAESSDSTVAVVHASRGRVTVGALARGTVTVTVTASDPEDLAATGVFRVTVPNRAPLAVDTIPNIEVEVGGEASMRLSRYFADADGDALAFTGASFDESVATAGVSDDRLTVRGVAKGMSAITVTAEDPEGLTAVLAFEVRVPNRPPRVTAMLPGVSVEVGETAAADLTEHFTEPDGDELVFAAESSDPDVATADISGDRVTVEAVAKGVATVTITAADPEGLAVEQSFLVLVPNRAPQGTRALPDLELQGGEESAADLTEHFADPDGDMLRFTAESTDSTVAVADVSGDRVTVSALARGAVTVTVTASDPEDLAATAVFQVTIANGGPRVHTPMPGRRLEAGGVIEMSLLDHFSDPDGDSLVFRARSSDSSVVSVDLAGSGLTVEARAKGWAEITVTATDPASLEAESNFAVRVPNRVPRTVRDIGDQRVGKGGRIILRSSRYFSDPDGDDLSIAAESSDTTVAVVRIHDREVRVRGIEPGTATVTITATDPEGLTAAQSFGVRVSRRNHAPQPEGSIPDQSLEAGSEVATGVSDYFADPDGDDLAFAAESSDTALARASISEDQLTIVAVDIGTATVTVTATDPGGLYATQSMTVTVAQGPGNQAPRRVGRIVDRGLYEGDEITIGVSGYFTDPDGDRLTFAAAASNPGAVTAVVSGGELTLSAVSAGTANVVVKATDPGGLTATQPFTVRVRRRGSTGNFNISLHFTDSVPVSHRPVLEDAASWWRSVVSDTEWADVAVDGTTECRGVDVDLGTVDDLAILVDLVEMDGDLGTAARAGVCVKRDAADAFAPVLGYVRIDKADIDVLAQYGDLWEVMVHEMTHVLGFGVRWVNMDLLDQESDPHFTGARALAAFNDAGGTDYPGAKVPTQPGQGHWRESVFGSELMTPSLLVNRREPLSAITLAALMDMGYHVDLSFADDYELDGAEADVSGVDARPAFDFSDDIGRGPEIIMDRDGDILRVIRGR